MFTEIKPIHRLKIFDLVEEAGFDVSDWIGSSNDPRGFKANPKYCYEWSFIQTGHFVILNLWYAAMREEGARIFQKNNFRADAEYHRTVTHKTSWAVRARRLDESLQVALRENLPVRVIVIDGDMRDRNDPELRASKVINRKLDPKPWSITKYDWNTGECELTRGILEQKFVDQFDINQAEKADQKRAQVTSTIYVRDPAVRQRVRARSNGKCELCGQSGFRMASGAIYVETHHIVPLSEGGKDIDSNVVAICADDHRRAHYASDRHEIAAKLTLARAGKS